MVDCDDKLCTIMVSFYRHDEDCRKFRVKLKALE